MRPNATETEYELYECYRCGARDADPRAETCRLCGGELHNIGRPRDL